jgi:hypothetical protein
MATRLLPGGPGVGGLQFNDNTIQYTANPTLTVAWANVTGRDATGGWKAYIGNWASFRAAGSIGNCGVFGLNTREQHFEFSAGSGQTFDMYYYNLNCTDCNCNCVC